MTISLATHLISVQQRIATACRLAQRSPQEVALLAVGKTWPASLLRAAYHAGQIRFGENYVQEALGKMAELVDLPLEWHFIGPIQANKTRLIAENFAWAHSIDRLKIAQRLSAQRPPQLPPLQVCIEVNLGAEASKSGCAAADAPALAAAIARLPQLALRGLMALPEAAEPARRRQRFHELRVLLETINRIASLNLDTLSMGMSEDFAEAILEGATIVRVGSALFGPRAAK